jgi:hypothetical protein
MGGNNSSSDDESFGKKIVEAVGVCAFYVEHFEVPIYHLSQILYNSSQPEDQKENQSDSSSDDEENKSPPNKYKSNPSSNLIS